jgi:predicted membrane-bound mannosyltransferase
MGERPGPALNRWLELTVPPEDLAEVAGWLQELVDRRSGRTPPGSARQHPVTAKLAAYAALARDGAMQVAARDAKARAATWAAPTSPVVGPAQPAAPSRGEITTAEAAAITGKSAEWWRQLAASGRIRARRGERGAWLLDRADVTTGRGTADGARGSTRTVQGDAGSGSAA